MKKLYNKINNKQWRMTVPNINSSIFRRGNRSPVDSLNRNSGFYDVQEAEKEYENSRSVPNSVYILESGSEDESKYQDARDNIVEARTDDDACDDRDVYEEMDRVPYEQRPASRQSAEYDVPRISFKFFDKTKTEEKKTDATYENTREDSSHNQFPDTNSVEVQEPNYEVINEKPSTPRPRLKSEMKIVLTAVEIDIGESDTQEKQETMKI
ncbi:hypothetical protein WA026_000872 [Henosepilachna vigintioctopunctata]|uniref:Uncharacterized protein n=1 Tax=Henosepilachna vigintioctopunctata TaxID=420089 RepID=A0AAW1V582_9CUCU